MLYKQIKVKNYLKLFRYHNNKINIKMFKFKKFKDNKIINQNNNNKIKINNQKKNKRKNKN